MLDQCFLKTPMAHRGLHDVSDARPENSRAAIRAAIAHGYGIEIDLQLSADGVAMVFHDYHLGRLTGHSGPVRQRTAAELGAIPLRGSDEGIPSFAQVLALVAGQVPLLVEIKDQDGALGTDVGVLEAAAAKDAQNYVGPIAYMSFNPHSMAAMAECAPDVARGLVGDDFGDNEWPLVPAATCERLRDFPDFERVGATFISHDHSDLDSAPLATLKARGVPVLCWTIHTAAQEVHARRIADNITFEGYLPPNNA